MKTFSLLFIGLLLSGMSTQAQKIYIRAGAGISVSTTSDYIGNYTTSSNAIIYTVKKQGLGTGLPIVIAGGYNISEHFAIELGIDYFYGFSLKQNGEYSFSTFSSFDSKWHGQMLSLVPAFVLSLPIDKFKPYSRLGLKLGVLNSVVGTMHETSSTPVKATEAYITDTKTKRYGGIAIGVQAAIGTDFVISDLLSLFGEIQVDGISYAPKHGEYLEYTRNGEDILGTTHEKDKKWNYTSTTSNPNNIPDDQPNEYPRINDQFGNVGLVLGVKINL